MIIQGLTSSLTVELSQVGMFSPNYTVNVTRGEILHVGESISNLTLSEGDTLSNSSAVIFTEMVRLVQYIKEYHVITSTGTVHMFNLSNCTIL